MLKIQSKGVWTLGQDPLDARRTALLIAMNLIADLESVVSRPFHAVSLTRSTP
jgi:hypothetical protein